MFLNKKKIKKEQKYIQCYLPIHVFWDQEFSVNLKSVNSKFMTFLPIHYTIIRKNRELGEVYVIIPWIRNFFRIDTKPWICKDSELGGRELGGNTVVHFFQLRN